MKTYFGCHNHTHYSNIRLLDCINKPKDLIDKAIELGLSGIAITDHECISSHLEVNQIAKELRETNPDFTLALGNEIYLTDTRDKGQRYFHFILIAKDEVGHKAIRELSSTAWYNSYVDRGMERVPTLKEELATVMTRYRGHLISSSACIGSELGVNILALHACEEANDAINAQFYAQNIKNYIDMCLQLFGEDFYIECAPAGYQDQMIVNKRLYKIARKYGIRMTVGTDAHYLRPEDRPIHKAYLNSKGGEREVDSFYEYSHLMTYDEAKDLLMKSFDGLDKSPEEIVEWIFESSLEIKNKIKWFDLERKQTIPKVKVEEYKVGIKDDWLAARAASYPIFTGLMNSTEPQERYWANECYIALLDKIKEKGIDENKKEEYMQRLETEADILSHISNQLNDCLYAYFNTFKHYIDLFWECGSIVGPGRGSATGFLSNYLLGITQLDPVRWRLFEWRFLNKDRAELPDIDIDLAPSKRPIIFEKIREERGEFGLVQVATFGSEGTKSAILTACRGYRSKDFPTGIDVDDAQYMSSLIPQERGFLWSIKDVVYGNKEKGREPVKDFIKEVKQYPGLLEIIMKIDGLINKRSVHASGVVLYGDDPYETASFMRTPGGDLITAYDLHNAEAAGDTKYDFLVTEISDKIISCIDLLQKDNLIPQDKSLREVYNEYLHPEILDTERKEIWEHLAAGDVLDVFQFCTGVGLAIAKKLQPQNPAEMTAVNALSNIDVTHFTLLIIRGSY